MLILNMGIPRSGTTWAFNVFRHLFDTAALPYTTANPSGFTDVDAAIGAATPGTNTILHFHDVTDRVLQRAAAADCAAFFNYRDPRDVVVSQMRLHETGFDTAVQMTLSAFMSFQKASAIPGLMLIPYPHIGQHAEALIFQMALKTGQFITTAQAATIAAATSIGRHQDKMQDVNTAGNAASVFSGQRHVRYDSDSLITDRHIQSGKTGRWKDELDQDQQAAVNQAFAAIVSQLGLDDTDAAH